jgi:hypothetical protein
MKARHGPPHVGTMIWASRAALGDGLARGRGHYRGRDLPARVQQAQSTCLCSAPRRLQCRCDREGRLEAAAFAGHSLRAGFVTSAVKRGANLLKITDVTGHRSLEMLKTYSRDAEAFVGHAGAGLL